MGRNWRISRDIMIVFTRKTRWSCDISAGQVASLFFPLHKGTAGSLRYRCWQPIGMQSGLA